MSLSDILYLKEENFVAKKVTVKDVIDIYSLKSEVNSIAKDFLFSIPEYFKLIRRRLPLKNKIPIYFSNKLLLFALTCNKTNYLINFFNIFKICYDNDIVIIFKNGEILKVGSSKRVIKKELSKINQVLEYKNKL